NGPVFRNMGIGGKFIHEKAGIFNTVTLNGTYAYHLKFSKTQALSFGLYAGVVDNQIAFAGASEQTELDPVIVENTNYRGILFDAGFGLLYRFQNLNAGIVVQHLLESKVNNREDKDDIIYSLKRHYKFHVSYSYDITHNFSVEPIIILSKTKISPLFYEAAAIVKYNRLFWLGATYRAGNCIGLSLGATFNRFLLSYSYELSNSGILGHSGGSHEITFGMLIGKLNTVKYQPSIFRTQGEQPYYKWNE
ncbi:MAG: type IX secretion system membrane protein PorP/SprF, partial [Bacteroidia bacterium]|nr:type IX secretion system membrane protein PorP/SprF [Bacteroidia bacterium]